MIPVIPGTFSTARLMAGTGQSASARTSRIRAHEVEATRQQVEEYRRFKALSLEFLEASEALAQARLEDGRGAKKASMFRFKP